MKIEMLVLGLSVLSTAAVADVIRPQCQTEESRGLRFTSAVADAGRATVERFRAEGRAALLKARALEAAHCPEIADAIINNGPTEIADKEKISADFEAAMQKEYADLHDLRAWQREHPQCEHVEWYHGSNNSTEDFSGNFKGKKGQCSADGKGVAWRGTKDDLTMHQPETNPLIAQVICANALHKLGFGEGSYADPALCAKP